MSFNNSEKNRTKPQEKISKRTGNESITLAQLLNQEVVLPVDEVLFLASEAAMRLARLHASGKIHGELTPNAIRINPDHLVNRSSGRETHQIELRNSGVHFSAPESFEERLYLSPETRVGKSDEQSDIFSLGCILCTCVSGAPPFLSKADRIANYRDQIHERLSGVIGDSEEGVWLRQLIEWCVAPEPQMRYRSAQQIVRDVNLIKLRRPPVGPHPKQESTFIDSTGSFGKAVRHKLRQRTSVAAAAVLVSGLGLLVFLTVWGTVGSVGVHVDPEPARPESTEPPKAKTHMPTDLPPSEVQYSDEQRSSLNPIQMEVTWNKPAAGYKLGDVFEYKIVPKELAYVYSFYIKNDKVSTFYPSATQKSNLVDSKGVTIDSFNDEVVLLVDQNEKGLLVTVGIPFSLQNEKFELVHKDEYSTSQMIPDKLQLTISAETLFARIQQLREQNPRATIVIQKAPAAKRK